MGGGAGSRGAEALIAPEGGGRLNRRARTSTSREQPPTPRSHIRGYREVKEMRIPT